jgi:hypothetical protein
VLWLLHQALILPRLVHAHNSALCRHRDRPKPDPSVLESPRDLLPVSRPRGNTVRLLVGPLLDLKGINHPKPIHTLEILNVPGDQR